MNACDRFIVDLIGVLHIVTVAVIMYGILQPTVP